MTESEAKAFVENIIRKPVVGCEAHEDDDALLYEIHVTTESICADFVKAIAEHPEFAGVQAAGPGVRGGWGLTWCFAQG